MNTIIKTVRGLLVLMALAVPAVAPAETPCRFTETGRITLTPAQLNPNVPPLKDAVHMRSGQPRGVDLKVLVPLVYERNSACATLPNGNPRPGWETPQTLTQAVANLNVGGATNVEWISFAHRLQNSGFRLPGFAPAQAAAAPRQKKPPQRAKPRTSSTKRATQSCGICSAGGLN